MWHPVHYIYDIISTLYDNTALCVVDNPLIMCVISFAWCHMQMWHDTHPLYQTSHPLYLCHHKLSTDLIPTFVWHRTHYMCDIICTLYIIISTPYVITLLYLWHHSLYIWNHIQYIGPHVHYTCDITATNRCLHSHSIDHITHTLYCITLAICVASFALYKTSHPRFMTSSHHFYDITPTIFDSISTVSLSSHPLYWWYHTNWISEI